jgi:hypothetical protein
MPKNDLQGTLDLLVLKSLAQMGRLHGYGLVLHVQRASSELLRVEEGALYPALHRMEQSGWINAERVLLGGFAMAMLYGGNRQVACVVVLLGILFPVAVMLLSDLSVCTALFSKNSEKVSNILPVVCFQ